ncbi:HNH endonuclease [Hansschlegelia beijingensis]|uniref:HNH endonuclease n=1 Tax=Hansschlegelia beijingensis TaxID=1133344 RepID=UPI00387F1AA4
MRYLPLPVATADDAVVERLAKEPEWAVHRAAWLAAYASYRRHSGSPFDIQPHAFGVGVGDRQSALYDTRKRSGELSRMRRQGGLLSCPVCGSPVTGHLDHYLPRSVYPEFSIMRANLVPACVHCNSGVKGDTVHGERPRRFIHPYFDAWADGTLWRISIQQPFLAATFRPTPEPGLPADQAEIVQFHLEHVLGDQFERSLDNLWSTYPRQLAIRCPNADLERVIEQVGYDLSVAIISNGVNSWQAAFFRGLSADANALTYVHDRTQTAALP